MNENNIKESMAKEAKLNEVIKKGHKIIKLGQDLHEAREKRFLARNVEDVILAGSMKVRLTREAHDELVKICEKEVKHIEDEILKL